jgi:hypothetical protein
MWDVWGDNDSEEDEPEIEDNAGVDEESENVEGIATAPKADENDIRDRNFVEEVLHLCLYMHHTHMTKQCVWLEERLMTMWTKEKLRKLVWKLQMRLRGNKQRILIQRRMNINSGIMWGCVLANGTVEADKADDESEEVFDPEKDKEFKEGEDDTTATLGRAEGEPEDELGADMKEN